MSRRRARQTLEPAALPPFTRLLALLLIPLALMVLVSLLLMNRINDHVATAQATATAVATHTTAAYSATQVELAGVIASRAIDVYPQNARHGLLLAIEAYKLISDPQQMPAVVRHAIWQVLALGTSKTLTGTLALPTAVNTTAPTQWLVTSETGTDLQLWPLQDTLPNTPTTLEESANNAQTLTVSPDGHWLLTYGTQNDAQLWDLTTSLEQPYQTLSTSSTVTLASFSPQTKWLAVSGETDPIVHLYALGNDAPASEPHPVQPLPVAPTSQPIRHLAFDPGDQWLAVTHADSFCLWDLTAPPGDFPIHVKAPNAEYQFTAVFFSADGNWLIATSQNEEAARVTLWHLVLEQLVADACTQAKNNFTEQEWRLYFPTRPHAETCP